MPSPTRPASAPAYAAGFEEAGTGPDFPHLGPALEPTRPITASAPDVTTRCPPSARPGVEELLAHRSTVPRQIDHLFVKGGLEVLSAEMVLHRGVRAVTYLSDHFAIMATVELP